MAKIILNGRFGGYGWSLQGIAEILKRKGAVNVSVDTDNWTVSGVLNGKKVNPCIIDREDPVAIQVLEDMGSEFCSSVSAKLYIEEYDADDFIPSVDEYDGLESLELTPRVTEERIRSCGNIDEVVKLLRRLHVIVQE